MKIKRKPIHAREDCIDANQGEVHVRIMAHRHLFIVDCQQGNDSRGIEIDLLTLHRILRDEIRRINGD